MQTGHGYMAESIGQGVNESIHAAHPVFKQQACIVIGG